MDKVPELLCNIFCHDCQGDNIEGEWQRDLDVWEMVFQRHVEDSSLVGMCYSTR